MTHSLVVCLTWLRITSVQLKEAEGIYCWSLRVESDFVKSAPDGVAGLTNPRETCWLEDAIVEQSQRRTDTSMCVIQHSHKLMKGFLE